MKRCLPLVPIIVFLGISCMPAVRNGRGRRGPRPHERPFVSVREGHFYAGDKRIRLWGVNLMAHHVRDHRGARVTVRRLKSLGFNCLHIWLPRGSLHPGGMPYLDFAGTRKRSGSPLDLLDYLVYLCAREGMYVSMPCLSVRVDEIGPGAFEVLPRGIDDRDSWLAGVRDSKRAVRMLKFVDERVKALYFRHAGFFLNRVNPYTGRRYAEEPAIAFWQLEDEMSFLAWPPDITGKGWLSLKLKPLWLSYLKKRYGDEPGLLRAWGNLTPGESWKTGLIRLFPARKHEAIPSTRLEDAWRFLYELEERFYLQYVGFIRSQAPPGKVIRVQPIAVDSLIYNRPGCMFPALDASDFECGTGFPAGGRLVEKNGLVKWGSLLQTAPPWRTHYATDCSCLRVPGMPYCPVAGSALTNDPFRAAVPLVRAVWASWQDWDGVFTYWWGYFTDKKPLRGFKDYGRQGLCYARPGVRAGGFEICHDEIVLSQHRVASAIFRRFLLGPAQNPVTFRLGRRVLFGPAATQYYHSRWPEIPATAWARGAFISFDPYWDGEMSADREPVSSVESPLRWPNNVTWDPADGRLIVDTPLVKAFAGQIDDDWSFTGGVAIRKASRRFVCFALASEDGAPINQSRKLVVSLVSQSANTGYRFDPSRLKRNRFGYFQPYSGCVSQGRPPVKVQRVAAVIELPYMAGRKCTFYDSAERVIAVRDASQRVLFRAEEPVFYAILNR